MDIAASLGWFFCRKVQWVGRVSAPDRLFLKAGRYVWVEFKKPGEEPKESQIREHNRMRKEGAEVYVVDCRSKFREILTR